MGEISMVPGTGKRTEQGGKPPGSVRTADVLLKVNMNGGPEMWLWMTVERSHGTEE